MRVTRVLAAGFALFYGYHMAPGVLWGEPARRTLIVMERNVAFFDGGNHALGTLAGVAFSLLPVDPALSQNLMSVVFGVLALAALCRFLLDCGLSPAAAAGGAVALGVSHTFWLMSVIAETYTLVALLLVLYLQACRRFLEDPSPVRGLLVMLLPFACAAHHMLFLLFLPVAGVFFTAALPGIRRTWMSLNVLALAAGAAWLAWGPGGPAFRHTVTVHFAHWFQPWLFFREIGALAKYVAFQFPGPALALGGAGLFLMWRRDRRWTCFVLFLLVAIAAFASAYAVNRKFYLLVPAYLLFSLFVAEGIEGIWCRRPAWAWGAVFLSAAAPVLAYAVVSAHSAGRSLHPALAREIPFRNAQRYLLWPGKHGEEGAARFSRALLAGAGPRGLVLADYTIWAPLRYVGLTEGSGAEPFMTDNIGPGAPEELQERLSGVIDPALVAGRTVILAAPESVRFLRDAETGTHYEAFNWLQGRYDVIRNGEFWEIRAR